MLTLQEAKAKTLKRWRKILDDYPNIEIEIGGKPNDGVYGPCGFCQYYFYCADCLLRPEICNRFRDNSLFWNITEKLLSGNKRALKQMIQRMIREIEKVEA